MDLYTVLSNDNILFLNVYNIFSDVSDLNKLKEGNKDDKNTRNLSIVVDDFHSDLHKCGRPSPLPGPRHSRESASKPERPFTPPRSFNALKKLFGPAGSAISFFTSPSSV